MQDIAEACGLTRGAIYHHFHGKEEMLDAVTTYMFHETVPCREIQADTSRNGLETVSYTHLDVYTSQVNALCNPEILLICGDFYS